MPGDRHRRIGRVRRPVLVIDDMLGMFERTARFVKRWTISPAVFPPRLKPMPPMFGPRAFPGPDQVYAPRD